MNAQTIRRLYIAVAIVAIVPIWCTTYLPTGDGPSHLYNSWVMKELLLGHGGPAAEWFRIDWRPHPNWIGHAFMCLAMFIVPPLIAEKLFVTAIVLLFLYALWRYAGIAGEENRFLVFLAVPFAYNAMLQFGFYNFCFGAALYFLIVAVWWERRDRPDARTIALVAGLLLLCYFSHPIPLLLACGSIGFLWLATLPRRRFAVHARHLIALVPIVPLMAWFVSVRGTYAEAGHMKAGDLVEFLTTMRILYSFEERQLVYSTIVAAILGLLIVVTLARRRLRFNDERDAFIALTVILIILYVASPSATAGGSIIQERMALFVSLAPLAWLSPRLPKRIAGALAIALALGALAYCGYVIERYYTLGRSVGRFVRSGDAIGKESVFLPLIFTTAPPHNFMPIYLHAMDYAAIEKRSVNMVNYESVSGYFPTMLRAEVEPPDIYKIIGEPWAVNIAAYASRARYIFTWDLDAHARLNPQLAEYYLLASRWGGGSVYRAKFDAVMRDAERILLPFVGTTEDRGAPGGVYWRVEQSVRNTGAAPIRLLLSNCTPGPCAYELAPGASAPIAAEAFYIFAYAAKRDAGLLQFTTVLRRVDPAGANVRVEMPAIRTRDFRNHVDIPNVPYAKAIRLTLRIWTQDERPSSLAVTLRDASGKTVTTKTIALDARGAATLPDVVHDFGDAPSPVTISIDGDGARVWAFVSANEPGVPAPKLFFPR